MKSLVFLQYTLGGGGAEKALINIFNNIDYTRYKVKLVLFYKQGVYLDKVNKNVEIKYLYNPDKYRSRILQSVYYRSFMFIYNIFPKYLYRIIVGNKNDIEIAFLEGETTKLLNYSCNKTAKKIAWVHTNLSKVQLLPEKIQKMCYSNVDEIVCVSEDIKSIFIKLYPENYLKTNVIYNLINRTKIIELASEKIDYDFEAPIIVGIGRLTRLKRFDLLIRAHKLLIEEGIKNKVIIIGEGEERDKLSEMIDNLGVRETVYLLGFIDNPYPYILKSDMLVLSSDYEGLPTVICEAMVLGKPIIATNCTGASELIGESEYGILVDCGDELQMKEAIKEVILNNSLKENLGKKSYERSKLFNSNNIMMKINSLFNN